MNILFIGDVFGRPGRDLVRKGLRPLTSYYDVDFVVANVENAAGGFGITREIGDSHRGLRRRRHDVGQPHLGQEGGGGLRRRRASPAAARELPVGRAGPREHPRQDAHGPGRRGHQPDGARLHEPARRPVLRRAARNRRVRRAHPRDPGRFPRRSDVGEDRDGLAPRRPRDGGHRHAHPRADGRRAHPPERHGLHHRRRHDGPSRFDHRHRARARPRPVPHRHAVALRAGRRQPAPARRRHRRGRRDRTSHGDHQARLHAGGPRANGCRNER